MNMHASTSSLYRALVEIGVKPESARAIENEFQDSFRELHKEVEYNLRDRLMTTNDGTLLEMKLSKEIRDRLCWTVGSVGIISGVVIAMIVALTITMTKLL